MGVYGISGFNPTISLINGLYPTTRVTSASSLGTILPVSSSYTSISNLGHLLNAADALGEAATALAAPDAFAARSTASSKESVATGSAGATTPTGTYTVRVDQLAQAQTLTTATRASASSAIGNGEGATLTFKFSSGVTREVTLASRDSDLDGIASSINKADIGVKAEVVEATGGYQLRVTGQTGLANAFAVEVAGNTGVADLLTHPNTGIGPTLTAQARDAQGLINGTAFTSSTNKVNTAVESLTVNLKGTGTSNLTVSPNLDQTQQVSAFVEAYNTVQTNLTRLSRENPGLGFTLSFLRSELASALNGSESGFAGSTATLAEIGITANASGTLTLNASKLQSALKANPDNVAGIFRDAGKGIAERVQALTSDSLSADRLLEVAAPAVYSSAYSTQGYGQYGLASSLYSGSDDWGSYGSLSANVANQLLLANLTSTMQTRSSLLESLISQSRSFSQGLAGKMMET